jgi:Flp pilus assembly protein TadD
MRQRNQRALRIGAFLLPLLLGSSVVARSQGNASVGVRGRQVTINVIVRDSSEETLSVPATVKLFLNGVPCSEGSTQNGRISFTIADIGKFTAVVEAAGYKPGQNDINVAEPSHVDLQISLQRDLSRATPVPEDPILAPKAKEALDKGMQALRDNNLAEAEKALDRSMKLAPSNPQVLYAQGLLDLKKHEWTSAQSVLEKAAQLRPNDARALAALGMALCNQKKYSEAIPPLEKSLQLDPASGWETHWTLAESYYHSERFDEALRVSQQAEEESNGQVPQVDLLLARALTAVGRYEDSAKVLRELLKNHGDTPEAGTARRFLERLTGDGKIPGQ